MKLKTEPKQWYFNTGILSVFWSLVLIPGRNIRFGKKYWVQLVCMGFGTYVYISLNNDFLLSYQISNF